MQDDIFRSLRTEKIAEEVTEFLNGLLLKVENEKEFLDLVSIFSQSLGAAMATLDGSEEGGAEQFSEFILSNVEAGFEARREYFEKTGK